MDKIRKVFLKFSADEREQAYLIMEKIKAGDLSNLDIKKLSGSSDFFRVRKGRIRIIFSRTPKGYNIEDIGYCSEKTYRKF